MHPKEFKEEKAATGRFTHLCLENSEIHMGVCFDDHKEVLKIINNPDNLTMLLYPDKDAVNLSKNEFPLTSTANRQLVVIMLDATWRNAKKMYNKSRILQSLPKLMFTPEEKSRYLIKKQPHDWCLSTIEAAHELMKALEKAGLDTYPRPDQMLDLFARMQKYQIDCMSDPSKQNYRRTSNKVVLKIKASG
jgi:DTW domain-containing protein YfiP